MKRICTLLAPALLTLSAHAAVLTVNNNTPSPGQYATLAAAQTAASPGDTLLITGSPYSYNNFTITKRLTLIGTGHKPIGDFPAVSKVDNIDFSGTAASLYDCNIIGLSVDYINYSIANMRRFYVSRCKVAGYFYFSADADSVTLEGNFFENAGTNIYCIATYFTLNNITIKNNVLNGTINNFYPGAGGGNLYVDNNLFLYNGYAFSNSNRYLQFRNNIFYRADPNSGITSSTFTNNIIYQAYTSATTFPTSNSNSASGNLSTDPLFVSFPSAGDYYSYTYNFNLQSSSPAKNAGSDGKDIGLTGGSGYFQKWGIPNIPQINQFSITSPANATVAPGGTLQISVMSTITR